MLSSPEFSLSRCSTLKSLARCPRMMSRLYFCSIGYPAQPQIWASWRNLLMLSRCSISTILRLAPDTFRVAMYSLTRLTSSGVISVIVTPFCSDRAVRPALAPPPQISAVPPRPAACTQLWGCRAHLQAPRSQAAWLRLQARRALSPDAQPSRPVVDSPRPDIGSSS